MQLDSLEPSNGKVFRGTRSLFHSYLHNTADLWELTWLIKTDANLGMLDSAGLV
jgi:hypothetical protein